MLHANKRDIFVKQKANNAACRNAQQQIGEQGAIRKQRRLDDRWRRETAYHLSMISAALNARAAWDHSNAALWHRCTDLLATASHALQEHHEPPPEFRPLFERTLLQLRSDRADDFD